MSDITGFSSITSKGDRVRVDSGTTRLVRVLEINEKRVDGDLWAFSWLQACMLCAAGNAQLWQYWDAIMSIFHVSDEKDLDMWML